VAGQWQHTYNAFVTHPGKRDWVPQLTAICEHERGRTPYPILFLPQSRLGQYRLSRETAVEFSRDSVNVEPNRLRKFEQYLSPADVSALGEKRTSDTQVEVQEHGLALLRGTPRDLKGGQRRGRPVVSKEGGEVGQRLLDRGEPPLLAKTRVPEMPGPVLGGHGQLC
jgi:hypothetical protein